MTEKKKVNNNVKSHDRFFKKSMSYPEIAHEFFKSYLPKEVLEIIDLSTLKQESSSFLSNELGEGVSDVLYSVKYGEESGYISILLEHQSTSDRLITFRIQKYMLRLCEEHLRKQKGKKNSEKTLPNIYPVILYTGNKKYTAPRSFYELFENEELAKKFFMVMSPCTLPQTRLSRSRLPGLDQATGRPLNGTRHRPRAHSHSHAPSLNVLSDWLSHRGAHTAPCGPKRCSGRMAA